MPDKEVIVNGGKTIGEGTKITLTVKTLAWIIGILVVIFSAFYTDMKLELKKYKSGIKDSVKEEIVLYKENLTEVKSKVENIHSIVIQNAVNVGVLLDRTTGNREAGTSDLSPEENVPVNLPAGGN